MLRTILGAVCLFVVVGFVAAEEKKADAKVAYGKFKSFKDGTLTITTMKKGEDAKDVDVQGRRRRSRLPRSTPAKRRKSWSPRTPSRASRKGPS